MDTLMEQQHASASDNMNEQQMKDTLGGILNFLQTKTDMDLSGLQKFIPDVEKLAANAGSGEASRDASATGGSGLLGAAMGMFGNANQGGAPAGDGASSTKLDSIPQLLAHLQGSGVNPQQVMSMLPIVSTFLKEKANIDVSRFLGPQGDASAAPSGSGSNEGDMVGQLLGNASGLMAGFGK